MIKLNGFNKPFVKVGILPRQHWAEAQRKVEWRLHDFLGLSGEQQVIYFNRASSAFYVLLGIHGRYNSIIKSVYNYSTVNSLINRCPVAKVLTMLDDDNVEALDNSVYMPVAWGGCSPDLNWLSELNPNQGLIYDCAQSMSKDMYKGVTIDPNGFFIHSFESSKPYGSPAGGGCIVCHQDAAMDIRKSAFPPYNFFNPRAEQCQSTYDTLNKNHLELLDEYYEKCVYVHTHLKEILADDFNVLSGTRHNPTPTRCVLEPITESAVRKLMLFKNSIEIRSCYNGLFAIPTHNWGVVDRLCQEFSGGFGKAGG